MTQNLKDIFKFFAILIASMILAWYVYEFFGNLYLYLQRSISPKEPSLIKCLCKRSNECKDNSMIAHERLSTSTSQMKSLLNSLR